MRPLLRRTGVAIALTSALLAISSAVTIPADASDDLEGATASAHPAATQDIDFTGIVRLTNCSGSVIQWPGSKPTDKVMMLTNGHCRKSYAAGEVEVNVPSVRSVTLLNADGTDAATVSTTTLLYGTMSRTDVALYQLDLTYAKLKSKYGLTPLTIQSHRAMTHQRVIVISGYFRTAYRCNLNGFVYRLREDIYTWSHSLRYRNGCHLIHGTSGSPILKAGTRTVVGIHNTTNDSGEKCTLDNPCEVDRHGHITVHQGRHYGEETWWFTTCLSADGRKLDLDQAGCRLLRP